LTQLMSEITPTQILPIILAEAKNKYKLNKK
jgi:hypothetical protein